MPVDVALAQIENPPWVDLLTSVPTMERDKGPILMPREVPRTLDDAVTAAAAILIDLFHTLTSIEATNCPLPKESWEVMGLDREKWRREWRGLAASRNRGTVRDVGAAMAKAAIAIDPGIDDGLVQEAIRLRANKFAVALTSIDAKVISSLRRLRHRGKKLGLVSNADVMEIAAWQDSPLKPCFDVAEFSCEIGMAKPEPGIYEHACGALGVRPPDCVFVGDGNSNELEGARKLGMVYD